MAVLRYHKPDDSPAAHPLRRLFMLRNLVISCAVIQMISSATLVAAAASDFGTAEEAKAMLERAVAAVKADKANALDMFNNGEGDFKDRDLYVWCANASDGIVTATPYWNRGKQLRDIEGKRGAPFGETVMENASEGTIKETTYWWPRPGTDKPLEKIALYTRVGDQICSVGYYKD
jgi:Single Cache domain 2